MTGKEKEAFLQWYPGANSLTSAETDDFISYLKMRERDRMLKQRAAVRRFLKVLAAEGLRTVRDSREEGYDER